MPISHQQLTFRRQSLIAEPQTFLRRSHLNTPGLGAPAVSGQIDVHLSERQIDGVTRPGSILGILARPFHTAESFTIQCADPNFVAGEMRNVTHQAYAMEVEFNAHWVATSFYPPLADPLAPPAFPWYLLPNIAGPNLMFTQRLTGCSFLHRATGAGTEVAHIMPTPEIESGAALEERLREFFAGQNVTVYGRSRYNLEREVTIVGVRNGANEWEFFAQKRDLHSNHVRSVNQF